MRWSGLTAGAFLVFSVFGGAALHGQVMVSPTGKPSSLEICGQDGTFSLLVANTTGAVMSGATLTLDLPPSVWYTPGSATGATELDISNLNHPVFTLPGIANNTAHPVTYDASLICGYTNTVNFVYQVSYNASTYSGTDPPLLNYYFPSPVITAISNSAAVIPVNSTVTRAITVVQQGVGASLDTLYILDQHTSDITVISTGLGTLHPYSGPGPLIVDTILLTGADLPGGNGKFDAGETIVIPETVGLNGCTNGQSTVKAAWGCYGQLCNFYSAFPSVSPATGTPGIGISFTPNRKSWGFIDNSGFVEFTVNNTGTGTGGTAYNLVILSGFSSGGSTYYPNSNWINKIDSFSVNGNYLSALYSFGSGAVNGQYAFYTQLNYLSDPDGPGSGLEDADGDGFYDDLPAGSSFTVKAHTFYSWSQAQSTIPVGTNCGQGWTNSAWQGFRYGYRYNNQCSLSSGVNWVPNSNVNQLMTYNTQTIQTVFPADIYDGQPAWFEHTVSTTTAVNSDGCPADSVVYLVVLPPGVMIAPGYTATFKGVSMGTPVINGDSARYILDQGKVLSGGLFRVPVVARCDFPHSPTGTIKSLLRFWCDKLNYHSRYFSYWCATSPLFGIQCPVTNCFEPSISLFGFQRTRLGWTNDRCTTRISVSTPGIRLDHAYAGDSVRFTAAGRINGPSDTLFFTLSHNSIGGGWGNQLFFDMLTDTLRFYDAETATWHTCANLAPQITNGSVSSLTTDLGALTKAGGCLSGMNFTAGDSLIYSGWGRVKNVAQYDFMSVPGLRARFYRVRNAVAGNCNDLGNTFSVLGSNLPPQAGTNYQQIVIQGCSTFVYEGWIGRSLDICGGDIGFPNEYRPFCLVDTMTFSLPEGFQYQAGTALHGYFLDNGSFKTESIVDPVITMGPTGTRLVFIRTPAWGYPDYYDCSSNYDRIRFSALPSCKATGNFSYGIDARGRYQFSVDGMGTYKAAAASVAVTYTPPLMTLNRLVGTAEGRQDTVAWKVSLCNSRTFTAGNNWLGFESASAGISVVMVRDVTNPAVPVSFPLLAYGTGKRWVQVGDFSGGQCKTIEIKAVYTTCSFDSIYVRHGYNCSAYPVNPEAGYPPTAYGCSQNNTWLYLDPKPISLNVTVTSPANPADLCDTLDYETEVTNSQLAFGYSVRFAVSMPPGSHIVPGTSFIRYPYNSGSWGALSDPVNIPSGSSRWVYDLSSDPQGMTVLPGADSIPMNGYRLRLKVLTGCDFTSGKGLKFTASATNACGQEATRVSYSQPVIISGLPTNVSLYVITTQYPAQLPTCSTPSTFRIKVINLGPNSVSSIEKIGVNMDDAYDYVANSLTGIHNGPTGIASNTVTGGIRYINFTILPSLAVNDSIVFTFGMQDSDPGSIGCDTLSVETTTLLVAQVLCSSEAGGSCPIQSITSSRQDAIPVVKDLVSFGSYQAESIPNGTTGETVTINYYLKNSGLQGFNSSILHVVFVHDANSNGIPDDAGADSLYGQAFPFALWPAGDSLLLSATFNVPADKVCGLLAAVRLADNHCICGNAVLAVNQVTLRNAGPDVQACATGQVMIGLPAINGYSYNWLPSVYLDQSTVAQPVFSFSGTITQPDTLIYTLFTVRLGQCVAYDTMRVFVIPPVIATAGPDTLVCPLLPLTLSSSSVQYNTGVQWNSSGDGSFNDPTLVHPSYLPGPGDIVGGSVVLTLTAVSSCGLASDPLIVSITPPPVVTNSPTGVVICPMTSPMISLTGNPAASTFAWTASGSSINVGGYQPGAGNLIDQVLWNNGTSEEIVTYHVTPSAGGCQGNPADLMVQVHPVPGVTATPARQEICPGQTAMIALQSTIPEAGFTWTATNPSGQVSGFTGGAGSSIVQTLSSTALAIDSVTYLVTPSAFGCAPGPSGSAVIRVRPMPGVMNVVTSFSQCSGLQTGILLQPRISGTTFTWGASGSSAGLSGFGPGSGNLIAHYLFNSVFTPEVVRYDVTPVANGCDGPVKQFFVTVNPLPDTWFDPQAPVVCTGTSCNISLNSHTTGAVFSWTAWASSPLIGGYGPGNGTKIDQVLTNTGLTGTVTYRVTPSANGCVGTSGDVSTTVNPAPAVIQPVCFDVETYLGAKPYLLRGGNPAGGIYSGPGVNAGLFNPASAGTGSHHLTYTYTNIYHCDDTAGFTITVRNGTFTCGSDLHDRRDGSLYSTSLIGGKCWMAVNLNYGNALVSATMPQTDNCIPEKYCLPSDMACNNFGGLYQWDELMKYGSTTGSQGICPPEWHVPSESEWQQLINTIAAGVPLPTDGMAAAFLKDPWLSPGFNALTEGIFYLNTALAFQAGMPKATMFWTSTENVPGKAAARGLNDVNFSVSRYYGSKANAFPVRCIRDMP